jgi:hypothetical protein
MKGSQPKHIFMQEIPVKRLEVSDVENDPVPFRYWSIVQSLRPDDLKQRIALLPGIRDSLQ